jgi:hypothetical protein
MTQIIIPEELRLKLANLSQPVELCDGAGQVLGRFLPQPYSLLYEPSEPQVSDEELDQREREDDSCTTAEVLAYLEKLP